VLPITPVLPVIELAFDPITEIGDWSVRLETLAYGLVMFLALVAAAAFARRTPVDPSLPASATGDGGESNHLRADDLLYIAVAIVPGAVIGGRLGYVLTHVDFYQGTPAAILDINQGALELTLAVVGGVLTGSIVARMLGAPLGRWLHAAILPVLFALGAGKLAMVLGGSGQGMPFDGSWATAYVSPGPWGSLAPALPSHPAQVYEALTTVVALLVVMALMASGRFSGRTGGAFLLGLGLWAVGRAVAAAWWRDPAVLGPLNADQVLTLGVGLVAFAALAAGVRRERRRQVRADMEGGGLAVEPAPPVEPTGAPAGPALDAVAEPGVAPAEPAPEVTAAEPAPQATSEPPADPAPRTPDARFH
jgi:phosphatidylglycerol:prolipoprotein diacylglycerol transferase